MKALSIWQPWAWLILSKRMDLEGWHKYYENRTWACHYKGPLLIHAAKTYSWEGHKFIERRGISVPDNLPMGGLVGLVTMDGCVTQSVNPFFFGPYGFVFRNPIPFQQLVPCRGYQRIFEVDFSFELQLCGTETKIFGSIDGEVKAEVLRPRPVKIYGHRAKQIMRDVCPGLKEVVGGR